MRNAAIRRQKLAQNPSPDLPVGEEEAAIYLKDVELRFRQLLSPVEAYIMGLQSTLTWEIPSFSACVFIAVNIVFWLATRMRIYHLLGLTGLTVVFVDIWIHKIWPEIRVPPSPEELEEWTLVHPKLLSVPELSRHLARSWLTISGALHWLIILRSNSHAKFFVVMMLVLIVIGIVGLYISGITLLYILVMSVFIIPPLIYHNMLNELYTAVEPTIHRIEKMFNVKRTRSKKKGGESAPPPEADTPEFYAAFAQELDELLQGKKKSGEESGSAGGSGRNSEDSDEGLEEFVPKAADMSSQSLLKATSNESEEESTGHTPGLLTPDVLSQGGISRDISDTDSIGDEGTNFTSGLKAIPDYDDSRLDDSLNDDHENTVTVDDELPDLDISNADDLDVLPTDPMPEADESASLAATTSTVPSSDSMHFISGHFKDSSEEDGGQEHDIEGELASGLAFPDIQDELDSMAKEDSTGHAAMATEMVQKTMSSLMTSTMSGLSMLGEKASRLGETVRSAAKSATSGDTATASEADNLEDNPAALGMVPPSEAPRKTIMESTDSDILAEFEFLDQEDLDVLEDEQQDADTTKDANIDNKDNNTGQSSGTTTKSDNLQPPPPPPTS